MIRDYVTAKERIVFEKEVKNKYRTPLLILLLSILIIIAFV